MYLSDLPCINKVGLPPSASCPVNRNVNNKKCPPLVSVSEGCTYLFLKFRITFTLTKCSENRSSQGRDFFRLPSGKCDPPPRKESSCVKTTFAVARNLLQGCENVDLSFWFCLNHLSLVCNMEIAHLYCFMVKKKILNPTLLFEHRSIQLLKHVFPNVPNVVPPYSKTYSSATSPLILKMGFTIVNSIEFTFRKYKKIHENDHLVHYDSFRGGRSQ